MLQLMLALGAKPAEENDQGSLLYLTSFGKNAEEMALLLDAGMNPNRPHDKDEYDTYEIIEFDYRLDLWDLRLPHKPRNVDSFNEASWINFLERCAQTSNKPPPDQLRLLRSYGALTIRERIARREKCQQVGIIQRIVTGGQTGADRAGLDWAIFEHITHGGWCPMGRVAEDGPINPRYEMAELATGGYRARTRQNVLDSDGTLIVNLGELNGGTLQTLRFAEQLGKPYLVIQAFGTKRYDQAEQVYLWLHEQGIRTLNIAGPRESKRPGIYRTTLNLLCGVLGSPITSCGGDNGD